MRRKVIPERSEGDGADAMRRGKVSLRGSSRVGRGTLSYLEEGSSEPVSFCTLSMVLTRMVPRGSALTFFDLKYMSLFFFSTYLTE